MSNDSKTAPILTVSPQPSLGGMSRSNDSWLEIGLDNPQRPSRIHSRWTVWHSLSLLLIVVVIGAIGATQRPQIALLLNLAMMVLFTTIAGHGVVGLWRGVLIDERNKLSLSRLQMVLWTIVVLSGFLAAALSNIDKASPGTSPLAIGIPQEMWMLMAISTTSLVGSPLILSMKKAIATNTRPAVQEARSEELGRLKVDLELQNMPPEAIGTQGKIVIWLWTEDSRMADLFQGDEIGNQAKLDLGKVQMFFFTLVLVFVYIVMFVHQFSQSTGLITEFPRLDQSMIALLGISHAGYLMNKAVPKSVE